jgi:hypothetical protein
MFFDISIKWRWSKTWEIHFRTAQLLPRVWRKKLHLSLCFSGEESYSCRVVHCMITRQHEEPPEVQITSVNYYWGVTNWFSKTFPAFLYLNTGAPPTTVLLCSMLISNRQIEPFCWSNTKSSLSGRVGGGGYCNIRFILGHISSLFEVLRYFLRNHEKTKRNISSSYSLWTNALNRTHLISDSRIRNRLISERFARDTWPMEWSMTLTLTKGIPKLR